MRPTPAAKRRLTAGHRCAGNNMQILTTKIFQLSNFPAPAAVRQQMSLILSGLNSKCYDFLYQWSGVM